MIDHHASERAIEGSLEAVARAAREVGVRLSTCFEVTDRDGPEVARRGIEENARFARTERGDLGGLPQVVPTFGLHAAFTLSDATLARSRDAARESGLPGFHVHVAESRFDGSAVTRLAKAGILGPKTIAAHCVHVREEERALLAKTGTLVVTNPSSNRNNAVGRADLVEHLRAGISLGLGTDGMSPDVLAECAQVFLGCKDEAQDPRAGWVAARAALAGTKAVADALFGLGPSTELRTGLGAIAEGGPADLIIVDYDPWTPFDGTNWPGHVLYGGLGSRVRHAICGGRWVLRNGRAARVPDLERHVARARERALALWNRRRIP